MEDKVIMRRAQMVEHMHELIVACNNEMAYMNWIYTVPDQATSDDFLDIAEDDDMYSEVCHLFRALIKQYGGDGFYVCDDRKAY